VSLLSGFQHADPTITQQPAGYQSFYAGATQLPRVPVWELRAACNGCECRRWSQQKKSRFLYRTKQSSEILQLNAIWSNRKRPPIDVTFFLLWPSCLWPMSRNKALLRSVSQDWSYIPYTYTYIQNSIQALNRNKAQLRNGKLNTIC